MASNPKRILDSALAKWRKNAAKIACHENARIIQKFCRGIHDKIMDEKRRRNAENYKNLANILNRIRASPKDLSLIHI